METGRLTSKGQITIPKRIREYLSIQKNTEIVFLPVEEGKVLITAKRVSTESLFGSLKHRRLAKTVSIDEMNSAIQNRRRKRGYK